MVNFRIEHSFTSTAPGDQDTRFRSDLAEKLKSFDRVGLDQINTVSLMKRIDTKCWFDASLLSGILNEIAPYYELLEIDGSPIQLYKNTYYDTQEDSFYLDHQNGRTDRIKVRKREYVASDLSFLEVKRKNNKGITKKCRIQIQDVTSSIHGEESAFLRPLIDDPSRDLKVTVKNQFKRITLIHKHLEERCTIDFDLHFQKGREQHDLDQIVIIELKHGQRGVRSELVHALKIRKIRPKGFSKYCMGRALLDSGLKQNALKPTLLKLTRNLN